MHLGVCISTVYYKVQWQVKQSQIKIELIFTEKDPLNACPHEKKPDQN